MRPGVVSAPAATQSLQRVEENICKDKGKPQALEIGLTVTQRLELARPGPGSEPGPPPAPGARGPGIRRSSESGIEPLDAASAQT